MRMYESPGRNVVLVGAMSVIWFVTGFAIAWATIPESVEVKRVPRVYVVTQPQYVVPPCGLGLVRTTIDTGCVPAAPITTRG